MTDFRDLVGDDLTPEEEARLRRVHELLLEAGPPPELPPELATLEPPEAEIKVYPHLPRRRVAAAVLVAAAVALFAFGGGYLFGNRGGDEFQTQAVIAMHPPGGNGVAHASISLGSKDNAGNWPIVFKSTNLPEQPTGHHYDLWLTDKTGRLLCGSFRVNGKTTTVSMNVPYRLGPGLGLGWVVTADGSTNILLTT
jgi:hypothetical protein